MVQKEEMHGFVDALKRGVVVIEFYENRTDNTHVWKCTLNRELSGGKVRDNFNYDEFCDNYPVWNLEVNSWRSIRRDSITKWYEE